MLLITQTETVTTETTKSTTTEAAETIAAVLLLSPNVPRLRICFMSSKAPARMRITLLVMTTMMMMSMMMVMITIIVMIMMIYKHVIHTYYSQNSYHGSLSSAEIHLYLCICVSVYLAYLQYLCIFISLYRTNAVRYLFINTQFVFAFKSFGLQHMCCCCCCLSCACMSTLTCVLFEACYFNSHKDGRGLAVGPGGCQLSADDT